MKKTTFSICPVCKMAKKLSIQRSLIYGKLPWFVKTQDIFYQDLKSKQTGAIDSHSDRKVIPWACNECIEMGRALIGDTGKQQFCDCWPYYSYFDEDRECADCGQVYLFSKEEQKHWYETLKFWVQSRPKYCKACMKKRKAKNLPKAKR